MDSELLDYRTETPGLAGLRVFDLPLCISGRGPQDYKFRGWNGSNRCLRLKNKTFSLTEKQTKREERTRDTGQGGETLGSLCLPGHAVSRAVCCFWNRALFQARLGVTEAGVPAPGHPPRAARLPVAAPSRVPRAQRGCASRADRCARGAYPGDDRGVPGGGREQQEQQQQRGAARAPHGALGAGGG